MHNEKAVAIFPGVDDDEWKPSKDANLALFHYDSGIYIDHKPAPGKLSLCGPGFDIDWGAESVSIEGYASSDAVLYFEVREAGKEGWTVRSLIPVSLGKLLRTRVTLQHYDVAFRLRAEFPPDAQRLRTYFFYEQAAPLTKTTH